MLCPKPIFFGRATWTTPFQPKLVGENSNFLLVHRLGCVRSSGLGGRLGRCVGQGTLFVLLHNGALPEYSVSGLIILLTGRRGANYISYAIEEITVVRRAFENA